MHCQFDPDLYEVVTNIINHGPGCSSGSISYRPRPPEHVARIKAERLAREEDDILRRADAIRARRKHTPEPENAEDRVVAQAKAKAMSDKCGIPEDDDV